jgi:hypothetical protein
MKVKIIQSTLHLLQWIFGEISLLLGSRNKSQFEPWICWKQGWGAGAGCFWLLGAGAAWNKKSGAGAGKN